MITMGSVKAFTLIELLIVIAIIAILAAAIFLFLNPLEYFRAARDNNRHRDASSFREVLDFNAVQRDGNWDPDGSYTESCVGELNQRVFVSVPSDNSEISPEDLPAGWIYERVLKDDMRNIDGSGWIPVNLTGIPGGSPLSVLPIDPTNTFASGYYYSYVCSRDKLYEITARMASKRFRTGGAFDIQSNDGGDDIFMLERGTDLQLDPKAPVGYWAYDEGSGTVAGDSSSNNNIAIQVGNPTWITDCIRGSCIELDGSDAHNLSESPIAPETNISVGTIISWLRTPDAGNGGTAQTAYRGVITKQTAYGIFLNQDVCGGNDLVTWEWGGGVGLICSTSGDLEDDTWHHVVKTFDHGVVNGTTLYSDGVAVGTFTYSIDLQTQGISLGSGSNPSTVTNQYFTGKLDEQMLYNRVLTAAEIEYQYEALKP